MKKSQEASLKEPLEEFKKEFLQKLVRKSSKNKIRNKNLDRKSAGILEFPKEFRK